MSASKPHTLNPPDVTPPKPTYSHVSIIPISRTAKLITIAGQIGVDYTTGKVASTYSGQVALALANLGKCLVAAEATTRDIVKVTHYIVNLDPTDQARAQLYLQFMGDHRPPSTLVGVAARRTGDAVRN